VSGHTRFDLIILGAGPAGSAAAHVAARTGLRVALVDRRAFPQDKLCGGGITGRAMTVHERVFGTLPPPDLFTTKPDFAFYAHGHPLWAVQDAPPMHMTMRTGWDAALLGCALSAGARDYTGHRVAAIDTGGPAVPVQVTLESGPTLTAPALIGADGVNSIVARALFGRAWEEDQIGFGLEVEAPPIDPDAPVRIDFGAAAWGYGWQFPKPGSTTIGVGGLVARNPAMKATMAAYMDALGVDPDRVKVKGHHLPFGRFRRVPGKGAVLLAGDAAGLVDPITGEGIAHAMQSGALAAEATVAALAEGAPDTSLARYAKALRPIHRSLAQARAIRPIMFSPALRKLFLKGFAGSRRMRHDYLRMMAGEAEYDDLIRQLILRSPRYAGRALRGAFSGG